MAWPSAAGRRAPRPRPAHDALGAALAKLEADTGFRVTPEQKAIPDEMTFRQWCEKLGREGLKVDGKPFTLANRPAMAWLYDQIPATRKQAFRRMLVLMKCAQVGFTVMEILATIYLGLKFGPCTVGMFLPDMNLAGVKSSERFMPMVRSVPEVHALMTQESADGSGYKSGEGNVTRRRIDKALFVFSWTSGRATTESIPMDFLSFDEVQEMSLAQMEKTLERLSASEYRFTCMGSTANWPDSDIHHWYKQGTQHRFHTECPTCGKRKPLDDYFPDCLSYDPEHPDDLTGRPGAYRYVCPDGHWIDDPQRGEWIADNPEAWVLSAHFTQMLSPTISPGEIWEKYVHATDKKNFYNRVLGKPWLNPDQVPVTLEHMANCVEHGKRVRNPDGTIGVRWKKRAHGTFMGIDQMGQYNVVIIKERLPDGRQAVVHLEEVYAAEPFDRCSELMEQYGVAVAVCEVNPNFNSAQAFANRHPGRVFICNGFGELPIDMVQWGDAPGMDVSERRTDDEYRTRYTVKADQFRCMQTSFARFTGKVPTCVWPDPKELVQEVIEKGKGKMAEIAPRAFLHFTKTALVVEKVADPGGKEATTNEYKRSVRKIQLDPHFSFANQLCDVAWARAHGTATFIIPEGAPVATEQATQAADMGMPGLPNHVVGMLTDLPPGVCGRCSAYPFGGDDGPPAAGVCAERGFEVGAGDPGCPMFAARG